MLSSDLYLFAGIAIILGFFALKLIAYGRNKEKQKAEQAAAEAKKKYEKSYDAAVNMSDDDLNGRLQNLHDKK